MIVCAAIKVNVLTLDDRQVETIIYGRRHNDCFNVLKDLGIKKKISEVQGFIDTQGNFLDRKLAYKHAVECGQLSVSVMWHNSSKTNIELFSEDLY